MKSDTSNRFAYIETRLQWGDGLTARELADAFRLTRQTAQGLIDEYRQHYPDNLYFDPSKKKQVPRESFSPRHISKDAGHFMDFLRGMSCWAITWIRRNGANFHSLTWTGLPGLN